MDVTPVLERLHALADLVFIDKGSVVFKMEGVEIYDIPLSDLDSYDKILGWQIRLLSKQWAARDVITRFVMIVCEHHGLPITDPR
jgi:hypothetical protein